MDTDVEMSKRKENSTLHFLIMYDDHQLFKMKTDAFDPRLENVVPSQGLSGKSPGFSQPSK
ncbi:unnamed protein product [Ixodes persulcatus]